MDTGPVVVSHRKPRGQGPARRDEILAAAKRLFLSDGFEHATIRKIAAAVGVSSATLYVYFADKDAILRAIAESTFERLLRMLEEGRAAAQGSKLARFRAGLAAYIAFGRAHPDEYRLTFLAKMMTPSAPGRPCMPGKGILAADRSFEILEQDVRGLMDAGVFAPGDSVLAAEAVWSCMHGVTALLLDQTEHLESDHQALADAVIDMVLRGLALTPADRANDNPTAQNQPAADTIP
jgi:AcrR family transcriptional regulator